MSTKPASSFGRARPPKPAGRAAQAPVVRVAAVQMASGPKVSANLNEARRLIAKAAAEGAQLVALPEYFAIMGLNETDKVKVREVDGKGPIQQFLADTAREHKIWLIGGSIPLESNDPKKVRNSCLVYDDKGKRVARYDKIHLFGFNMGDESYSEERTIEHGDSVQVVEAPFGRIGLSICYDLRFPELYRAMKDVDLIVVPRNPRRQHDRRSLGRGARPPAARLRRGQRRHQPGLFEASASKPAGIEAPRAASHLITTRPLPPRAAAPYTNQSPQECHEQSE